MRGHRVKTAAAALVALAAAGCASTATPRVGYGGPPPLFEYQDGYVEDRSPHGPLPAWAYEPAIVGSKRYYWIPGSPEWYTFTGPQGPAGRAGPAGPQGPRGSQGRPVRSGRQELRALVDRKERQVGWSSRVTERREIRGSKSASGSGCPLLARRCFFGRTPVRPGARGGPVAPCPMRGVGRAARIRRFRRGARRAPGSGAARSDRIPGTPPPRRRSSRRSRPPARAFPTREAASWPWDSFPPTSRAHAKPAGSRGDQALVVRSGYRCGSEPVDMLTCSAM